MTEMARKRRWSRFLDPISGKALIVPIDHGLTVGPLQGIGTPEDILSWLTPGIVTGVLLHKGMAAKLGGIAGYGMMVQLNGALSMDDEPDTKHMLTRVDAAVRLGADAVSVQTNFSSSTASHNLRLLGAVVDDAHAFGLPVLAMVYDKVAPGAGQPSASLRHFMRAAVEMGVDAMKIATPANLEQLPELVYGIEPHTSVLFAGGPLMDEEQLVALCDAIVAAGASGLCVGRNLFQRPDPRATMRRLQSSLRQELLAAALPAYKEAQEQHGQHAQHEPHAQQEPQEQEGQQEQQEQQERTLA